MSDSDYTLIEEALNLGGHLVRSVDLSTGEVDAVAGVPCTLQGAAPRPAPLSTVHISPHITFRAGASLLTVSKGREIKQDDQDDEDPRGGTRGRIKGLSPAARRRLMRTIAGVRRDAPLPCFITLTYPELFPEPKQSKKHLDTFFKRLTRAFPGHGSIWKLEPQERGAPHYHLLTWGIDVYQLAGFVPVAWYEIAGGGDIKHLNWHVGAYHNQHCVQPVRSWRGVWSYASKYLGKTFEVSGWADKWTGRFWGAVNRPNIPFGELTTVEITEREAVQAMRYQRRFVGFQPQYGFTFTTFCNADQWAKNITLESNAPGAQALGEARSRGAE